MAKRVTESMSSSTCKPWSRKYSATDMATNAACRRVSGASSEVAVTITLFANPSGPKSSSMNSLSSRPRSPTKAITVTSASVLRAIMAIKIDLPTPEPENMPMHCPREACHAGHPAKARKAGQPVHRVDQSVHEIPNSTGSQPWPFRPFHKHFGPDALSGSKLNEANQRHIGAGHGQASVAGILK